MTEFDGLAKQFLAAIFEHLFHLRVHQDDLSRLVHDDHGIGCCFKQMPELLLTLLQFLPDTIELGEIPRYHRESTGRTGWVASQSHGDVGGKLLAVLAHVPQRSLPLADAMHVREDPVRKSVSHVFRNVKDGGRDLSSTSACS